MKYSPGLTSFAEIIALGGLESWVKAQIQK